MALNPTPSYHAKNIGSPLFQAILVLIALVLFSWFMLKPWLAKTIETKSKLSAAQNQLDNIENEQRELNRLVNELKSSATEVKLIDEALPLNGRVSTVYVLLDNMVRTSGMSMSVLASDDTKNIISAGDKTLLTDPHPTGRTLHTVTITASISGNMEQLKNFLQLLETNGRVLDVAELKVIGGEPITKFQVTVKAYAFEKVDKKL